MLNNPSNNTFCSRFLHDLLLFYVSDFSMICCFFMFSLTITGDHDIFSRGQYGLFSVIFSEKRSAITPNLR